MKCTEGGAVGVSVAILHLQLSIFSLHRHAVIIWYRISHIVRQHDCNENDAISSGREIYGPNAFLHAFQLDCDLKL